MSKEQEYNGPEENEVYSDTDTFESFDDLDVDDTFEDEPTDGQQSSTSHEGNDDVEEEQDFQDKKDARIKKEQAKKARGQKSDDMEALELEDEEDEVVEEEDEEEEDEDEKAPVVKESDKPAKTEEEKGADGKPLPKGKPTYVTVDGETYSLDSNAVITTQVDGKNEKVTLQELKNNYAGKVAYDKKFNEINLKEQNVKRTESDVNQKLGHFTKVKQQIDEIIKDPSKNPKDALKIFLDQSGVDSYDLMERMFKADLTELSNVLNMEPAERKAYFLEKKNSHLLEQSKKRDEQTQNVERVRSYQQKVDALRKSSGVSEAQYVDALEELKSYGTDEKDISEKDIVEWAATKPHRETVRSILTPYADQLGEAYGELSWNLAKILLSGQETPEAIKKHLAEVYGVPTEVKQLSKKLNPLGRKGKQPNKIASSKKSNFESFEDIDDD